MPESFAANKDQRRRAPTTPDTLSADDGRSKVARGADIDSYFPPWEEYWSKKVPELPKELHLLLPTPISPALPVHELSFDDDDSSDGNRLAEIPLAKVTCSCPGKDTCVVESLALLLGSTMLLAATVQYYAGDTKLLRWMKTPVVEISKLEPTLKKLLLPLVSSRDVDVADLLLDHWRSPSGGTFGDRDLCWRIRLYLETMGIDLVDTFAPMQYDLHLLLALIGYDDLVLQSKIEDLSLGNASAKVRLLVEANSQLIAFSVKDILATTEELQQSLRGRIEDFACQVDMCDLGASFEALAA